MIQDIEKVIRDYLPDIIHMSLATCRDGKPRVCEVHYVFDDELNLYFRSKLSRRHIKEIESNPFVAGSIVKQHDTFIEKPRGVYFEGSVTMMDALDEHHPVYRLFHDRFALGKEIIEEAHQDDGHRFYKIVVETFYLFDKKESDPSQKYVLPWNGSISDASSS